MGHIYENGLGVKADREEALHWYQLSADQGYELGVENLNRLQNDTSTPADDTSEPTPITKSKSKDKISN